MLIFIAIRTCTNTRNLPAIYVNGFLRSTYTVCCHGNVLRQTHQNARVCGDKNGIHSHKAECKSIPHKCDGSALLWDHFTSNMLTEVDPMSDPRCSWRISKSIPWVTQGNGHINRSHEWLMVIFTVLNNFLFDTTILKKTYSNDNHSHKNTNSRNLLVTEIDINRSCINTRAMPCYGTILCQMCSQNSIPSWVTQGTIDILVNRSHESTKVMVTQVDAMNDSWVFYVEITTTEQ